MGKPLDPKYHQVLIDKITRNLETIRHLRNYARLKETLPVLQETLSFADDFKQGLENEAGRFKNIFPDSFWQEDFNPSISRRSVKTQLGLFCKEYERTPELALESIDYPRFLNEITIWMQQNIFLFRQISKTPRQKKLESLVTFVSWATLAGMLSLIIILNTGFRKWGLSADYYEGLNFDKLLISTTNKSLNFTHHLMMDPRIPAESFSVHWQGDLITDEPGNYVFYLTVDDGAKLFIDDAVVIDEWSDHDNANFEKSLYLSAGTHSIRLDYYNHHDKAILKLRWATPSDPTAHPIPAWHLRTKSA
jgi:hypothetical protein